uniref:Uncharacterized protein n=1 Tax=Arundo donax TaxID=35708 RepID=A0A0A8ZAC2_ARUDO
MGVQFQNRNQWFAPGLKMEFGKS